MHRLVEAGTPQKHQRTVPWVFGHKYARKG